MVRSAVVRVEGATACCCRIHGVMVVDLDRRPVLQLTQPRTLQRSHAWPVRLESASFFLTEPEKSLLAGRCCGLAPSACSMRWILWTRLGSSSGGRFVAIFCNARRRERDGKCRGFLIRPDASNPENASGGLDYHLSVSRRIAASFGLWIRMSQHSARPLCNRSKATKRKQGSASER